MKRYLFTLMLCCLTAGALKAQEVLYLKDGRTMEVYIKKQTNGGIYYSGKLNGPRRYISKGKVAKIVNARGREVVVKEQPLSAANNMVMLAPFNVIVFGNYGGVGVGISYERFTGPQHRLSVRIPVYLGMAYNVLLYKGGKEDPYQEVTTIYTAPGVYYHWLKPEHKVDLSTGISVNLGNLNQTFYNERDDKGGLTDINQQPLLTAITIDNDFAVFSRHRRAGFGVHTAFGPMFGDFAKDGKWMFQFGIRVGGKF